MTDALQVPVVGGSEDQYVYVGSGDHLVLLCDKDAPKWRNAIGLTPEAARKLATALTRMADSSETPRRTPSTTTT